MDYPKLGEIAPDFTLPASDGSELTLSNLKGKNVVLYFYPKDNTPGCTMEACSFKEKLPQFQENETVVLGVSTDSIESHQRFIERFKLPFLLLSDQSTELMRVYGAWQEKSMFGKKYMGIQRCTFLIDKKGILRRVWPKVKVKGHVEEVLNELIALDQIKP